MTCEHIWQTDGDILTAKISEIYDYKNDYLEKYVICEKCGIKGIEYYELVTVKTVKEISN